MKKKIISFTSVLLRCNMTICSAADNVSLMSENTSNTTVDFAFYNETEYVEKTLSGNMTFEVALNNNSSENKSFSTLYVVYDKQGKMKKRDQVILFSFLLTAMIK